MKKYKFQNRSQKKSQSCVPLNTFGGSTIYAKKRKNTQEAFFTYKSG
jgi:hypothetical protein